MLHLNSERVLVHFKTINFFNIAISSPYSNRSYKLVIAIFVALNLIAVAVFYFNPLLLFCIASPKGIAFPIIASHKVITLQTIATTLVIALSIDE